MNHGQETLSWLLWLGECLVTGSREPWSVTWLPSTVINRRDGEHGMAMSKKPTRFLQNYLTPWDECLRMFIQTCRSHQSLHRDPHPTPTKWPTSKRTMRWDVHIFPAWRLAEKLFPCGVQVVYALISQWLILEQLWSTLNLLDRHHRAGFALDRAARGGVTQLGSVQRAGFALDRAVVFAAGVIQLRFVQTLQGPWFKQLIVLRFQFLSPKRLTHASPTTKAWYTFLFNILCISWQLQDWKSLWHSAFRTVSEDHMDVSKNRGTPTSSILIGFSIIINHPFWGTIIFGNTHIKEAMLLNVAARWQDPATGLASLSEGSGEESPCL